MVQFTYSEYMNFLSHSVLSPPTLLAFIGALVFIVSFVGCCGAIQESHALTRLFTLILVCLAVMEVGAVLAAYHLRDQVSQPITVDLLPPSAANGDVRENGDGHVELLEVWIQRGYRNMECDPA